VWGALERFQIVHWLTPRVADYFIQLRRVELSADERAKIMAAAREYLEASWSWQLSGLPILVVYGENEPFIEPHADFLETELEDCRTAAIPEGSHNAHVDNPEFIRTELREFLTDVVSEREPAVTG
jgi:pimeloyl-ACP methyl ester carboxylesterase